MLSLPLAVLTVASVVGNLLAPHLLVANPLVLVVLAPRTLYLTVAAGHAPFGVFLAVGVLRLAAADPSHYLLGRLHGPRLTELAQRRAGTHRVLDIVLRAWRRIGLPLVALSPSGKFLVLAGASGMRHRRVAAVALGGTLAQLLLLYAAGQVMAEPGQALASLASDHSTALVLVAVVATMAVLVKAGLRRRPGPFRPAGDVPAAGVPAGDVPAAGVSAAGVPAAGVPAAGASAGDEGGLPGVELDAAAVDLLEQQPLAACTP